MTKIEEPLTPVYVDYTFVLFSRGFIPFQQPPNLVPKHLLSRSIL